MDESLPKILKDNCLDESFKWVDEKIWELDLPIEKMSMKDLDWQFELPFWRYKEKKHVITPNQVMKNPKKYSEHYKRIMNCDLKHPIDIIKNPKGRWEILDGLHRLTKAKVLRMKEVNVRKIPDSMKKDIIP